jgi:hypothetical protein
VRRMRPSPFHKGSGDAAAPAAMPAAVKKQKKKVESSEDEVRSGLAVSNKTPAVGPRARPLPSVLIAPPMSVVMVHIGFTVNGTTSCWFICTT